MTDTKPMPTDKELLDALIEGFVPPGAVRFITPQGKAHASAILRVKGLQSELRAHIWVCGCGICGCADRAEIENKLAQARREAGLEDKP